MIASIIPRTRSRISTSMVSGPTLTLLPLLPSCYPFPLASSSFTRLSASAILPSLNSQDDDAFPFFHQHRDITAARVSLKLFTLVYLGPQGLDQLVVLFYPIVPSACTGSTHVRIELIASQPKKFLRLFPLNPAFLAVFPRHDSGAEGQQVGYGVKPLPAVPHPGDSFAEQCVGLGEFGRIGGFFRLEIGFANFGQDEIALFPRVRPLGFALARLPLFHLFAHPGISGP